MSIATAVFTIATLSSAAAQDPSGPGCATFALPEAFGVDPVPYAAPPGGVRGVRDAEEVPNAVAGERVVVKWGSESEEDLTALATALLSDFEAAWDAEVGGLGYPAPQGSESFLLNVYISGTGPEVPEDRPGAAGYFTLDAEGWPMIAMTLDSVRDADQRRSTAAHELFHALQHATGRYRFSLRSRWYFEATATWAAAEVTPLLASLIDYKLVAYAMNPHISLEHFRPATQTSEESSVLDTFAYGAFLFPHFLAEQVGRPSLIRDSWVEAGAGEHALDVLGNLLAEDGIALEDTFLDFAVANSSWDYADGALLRDAFDSRRALYAEDDHTYAVELRGRGTHQLLSPPPELLPQRFGYNLIRFTPTVSGPLTARMQAEAEGSEGSPASFRTALLVQDAEGTTRHELPLTEGEGELVVPGVREGDEVTLVVTSTPGWGWEGEVFPYRFSLDVDAADPDLGEEEEGPDAPPGPPASDELAPPYGCSAAPADASWAALGLLGLMVRRRRPRRRAAA